MITALVAIAAVLAAVNTLSVWAAVRINKNEKEVKNNERNESNTDIHRGSARHGEQ
jgi:hypothetical protein